MCMKCWVGLGGTQSYLAIVVIVGVGIVDVLRID